MISYLWSLILIFSDLDEQAFAWFSDLLVEHAEIFWSMFAADMDQVLAEQPPDTWDAFPLFQILNDYLREDGKLKTGLHSFICDLRWFVEYIYKSYIHLLETYNICL